MDINQLYAAIDLQHISDYVINGQEEHLTLDFKTVSNANLKGEDDKRNFAKALSGFANSSGGLIIWGIDARKNPQGIDCAVEKKPISSLRLFVSRLNELTGSFVSPIVDGVVHRGVETSSDTGFAITLVPASSSGPHMAKAGEDRYYKRSGDSFCRMEHFDLEDMFGRRPKPKLNTVVRGSFPRVGNREIMREWSIDFDVVNEGRGIAKFVCLQFQPDHNIKPRSIGHLWGCSSEEPDSATGDKLISFELNPAKVIHPGRTIRFARGLTIEFHHSEVGKEIELPCTIYCEGAAPIHTTIKGKLE
jgi:hypothetical protein